MKKSGFLRKLCGLLLVICMMTNVLNLAVIVQAVETDASGEVVADEVTLLGETEGDITDNDTEYVSVSTADELEEAIMNGGKICLVDDFEIDRTFYITNDTYIYSDEAHVLTRATDFGGDIFVVGEDSEGTAYEGVVFTLGNTESTFSNLLTIDGNGDYMSTDVTGTVVFICNNAQADFYENLSIINCKKVGNEKTLDEKYRLSYTNRIGGAAVILASGTLNIYGGNYSYNSVNDEDTSSEELRNSTQGGAIYSFGSLNIYGGKFENNYAARGGALYNYRETHIYNASFNLNEASAIGGAIYMPNSSSCYIYTGEANDMVEPSVTFSENTSAGTGGAIYAQGVLNMQNTEFISNTATENGGAIIVNDKVTDNKTLTAVNCKFDSNTSAAVGGAVHISSGAEAYFENTEFVSNEADSHGGAIAVYDKVEDAETLIVKGCKFESNSTMVNGGAVYLSGTDASFENTDFDKNGSASTSYGGGAIYSTASTFNVSGGTFTNNTSDCSGGAISLYSGTVCTIDGATVSGNTAVKMGGSIYSSKSTVTVKNSDFNTNTAGTKGGAVMLNSESTGTIESTSFRENSAGAAGGAINFEGGTTAAMNDITANKNTTSKGGGFVYAAGAHFDMYNSDISENEATEHGGAVSVTSDGSANIYNTKFSKNISTLDGGAVYAYTGGKEVLLHSCDFSENSGRNGGAVYASNKSILKLYNADVTGNSAVKGGFLYETTTGTEACVAGVTLSGNKASEGGPIIWGNSAGATLYIDKSQYTDSDKEGSLDDTYWADAIVNKLTVYDITITIPKYDDYGSEENPDEGGNEGEETEGVTVSVTSAAQLEQAINAGYTSIRIAGDFELDRTFYITKDTNIFSSEKRTLTRSESFGGDVFVIGENKSGQATESPIALTVGNSESKENDLLVIDGNKNNMTATVTGTIFFISNDSTVNFNKNLTVKNCLKNGNERTYESRYGLPYTNRIGGAAVILASGTVNIYESKFIDNSINDEDTASEDTRISSQGGAIYSHGTLNVFGGTFSGNHAARGGALYNYKTSHIYNAVFDSNTGSSTGGAVYVPNSADCKLYLGSDTEVIESKVVFSNNSSDGNGGAISSSNLLNIKNTEFIGNESTGSHGGAIVVSGTRDTHKALTMSDSLFEGNTAAKNGGAIYFTGSDAYIKDVTFAENIASSPDYGGGALYLTGSVVEINGATFEQNEAVHNGGALALYSGSTLIANKLTATGNKAGSYGGLMQNKDSTADIYNSTINENEAKGNGGAISLIGTAVTNIYKTKFEKNTSSTNGGVFYAYTSGTQNMAHSCTFNNNTASNYGGVAYASNKTILKLYNTTATGNEAKNGGFLYETTTGTEVHLIGATVSDNKASAGGPIIWGNSTGATLYIDKAKYTDSDHQGEYDDAYWASAIVNKLKVNDVTETIPKYLDYGDESYDDLADSEDVATAAELETALNNHIKNIRITESFEVDRTFYITHDALIFATKPIVLTRKADFAGDIFVIGEDAEGNSGIKDGVNAILTLGSPYSETPNLLTIDGNKDNMTVDVTGSALFISESAQVDMYKGAAIVNCHKVGNVRACDEKYVISNATRLGGAAVMVTSGTLNLYGATFKNNVVNEEYTGEGATESDRNSSLGGAIYNRGNINIYDATFDGNVAARGGAIYNGRVIKVLGGTFINNNATTHGGAIYLSGTQYCVMYMGDSASETASEKILFKNNNAKTHGGGIYCATVAALLIYGDTTFEANTTTSGSGAAIGSYGSTTVNNTIFKNNLAYNRGGAMYIANSSDNTTTRLVSLNNCDFNNNISTRGGAIAIYSSDSDLSEGGKCEVENCRFVENKAVDQTGGKSTDIYGGAVYVTRKGEFTVADSTFSKNEANVEGGAIYAAGESVTNITNTTFDNNITTSEDNGKGGVASVHSATLNFDKSTFTENKATKNGGALYISYTTASDKNSKVSITESEFMNNSALTHGGAMYVTKHPVEKDELVLTVKNTKFEGNSTGNRGGAVHMTSKADAYMKDVEFIKNKTTSTENDAYAGALYLTNSSVEIDGVTFTENTNGYYGGAVTLHSASRAVINNATATGNEAGYGAFIHNSSSELVLYNSTVKNNKAAANGGAMTFMHHGTNKIFNTLFEGNTAGNNGGAVYAYTDETDSTLNTCTFKNNSAANFGGVAYASNGCILNLYNTVAENNSASNGGFMYETTANTEVTINKLDVKGNSATATGPIIYGNSEKAILNINKINYTDADRNDTADDEYWEYAIVNKLTVNDTSGNDEEVPPCEEYIPRMEDEEEDGEKVPVPVDDVLSLGTNSSNDIIDKYYGSLPELDTSSNFMSRNTTLFEDINGEDVTVDSYVYHPGDVANNGVVGEGILLYQAILYKQAHPEEDVKISLAAFRMSSLTAVCINRNSRYFGYARNLPYQNYDEYGFVRISYLLITAAKMGVDVAVIGQIDGYPQPSNVPTFYEYFESYLDEPCDPEYVENGLIGDYLNFAHCEWTSYGDKAATDMMHLKTCAVSHYIDMNGVEHKNALWTSSSNLDGINTSGTNGNNKLQTTTIVSDHEYLYRCAANYIDLLSQYCGQEEVLSFRSIAIDRATKQIDLMLAGRGDEIPADEQIAYIGTENDDVFELYFTPFAGEANTWNENYNPYCKYIRKLTNSDDYMWLIWNNANYNRSSSVIVQIENLISDAFHNNKNVNNKIYLNLEEYDTSVFSDLTVDTDIGLKSFNKKEFGALHNKDIQMSYSENGKRSYVSMLNSLNIHSGSMAYQSNFMLVIKEDNCDEDSVFFNIADNTTKGVVEHAYGEVKEYIPEDENVDGYTYRGCANCDKKEILGVIHRPSTWAVAKESTPTENGISYQICKGCGVVIAAKEVIGKETVVSNGKGLEFTKDLNSRVPVNISATPHTFEAVISVPENLSGRAGIIVSNYKFSAANPICFEIIDGGKVRLYYRNNFVIEDCVFTPDIRSNTPKHIAVTVDKNIATLYINGEVVESKTLTQNYPESYEDMYIGGDNRTGNAQYFRGEIHSVSLFSDVRTENEIRNDALVMPESGDNLLYSKNLEVPEEVIEEEDVEVSLQEASFGAMDSYSIDDLSAKPLTFEAVVNVPKSWSDRAGVVVSNYSGSSDPQIAIEIYTNGRPRLYANSSAGKIDCIFSKDIRSDGFKHMAITVDGLTATLYIDGVAVETKTINMITPEAKVGYKVGGDDRANNSQYFKGKIRSVALFDDVRTEEEIKSDITFVASNVEGLLYSGTFVQKDSKTVIMPIVGNSFSAENAKILPQFASSPYTFDAIINLPESVTGRGGVIAGSFADGATDVINIEAYTDGKVRLYYRNLGLIEDCKFDTDIRSNEDVRVSVVVDDNTAHLYINGEKVESKELTVPFPTSVGSFRIGGDKRAGNPQYFKGTIYSAAFLDRALTEEEIKTGVLYNDENVLYNGAFTVEKTTGTVAETGEGRTFSSNVNTLIPVGFEAVPHTFEAVVNLPKDVSGRGGVILGNYKAGSNELMSFEIYDQGHVRLYGKTGVGGPIVDCVFNTDIRSDENVHIAVTTDGLEATLFVNGERVETKTLAAELVKGPNQLKIGGDNRVGNGQYFRGTIYKVIMFSDVRTDSEIRHDAEGVSNDADAILYNVDFTKNFCDGSPIGSHMASGWIVDKEATEDQVGLMHTECTVCGTVLSTKEGVATDKVAASLDFTNLNAGITFETVEDAIKLDELPGAPKTFEAIFNLPKTYNDRAGVLIGNYTGGTEEQINIEIYNNGKPRLYYKKSGVAYTHLFTTDVRSDSIVHMTITVDGLNAYLYLNGELKETVTLTAEFVNPTTGFVVGADNRVSSPQNFKGTIYGINLFNDARTAEEVKLDRYIVPADTEGLVYSKYFTE